MKSLIMDFDFEYTLSEELILFEEKKFMKFIINFTFRIFFQDSF